MDYFTVNMHLYGGRGGRFRKFKRSAAWMGGNKYYHSRKKETDKNAQGYGLPGFHGYFFSFSSSFSMALKAAIETSNMAGSGCAVVSSCKAKFGLTSQATNLLSR